MNFEKLFDDLTIVLGYDTHENTGYDARENTSEDKFDSIVCAVPAHLYFRSGFDPDLPESEQKVGTISDVYYDDKTGDVAVDVWCGDALHDGAITLDPDTIK